MILSSAGIGRESIAAKMTRTSTEFPRLEPESSASTNSAMAAKNQDSALMVINKHNLFFNLIVYKKIPLPFQIEFDVKPISLCGEYYPYAQTLSTDRLSL
jgi:hypothetical protein